jgi:EAL domain-containing protein (putative c-di-GMP-specific phosphodiesterase class I)
VIEITEGLLLDATGQVKATLEDYKDKGIQVALDDFGTGYSSLAYLHKFNIDYLKIDISFVANLETNSDDRVLCHTIIEMAHNLGMAVIAEGVETKAQKDILLNAGCDYGQGYYFSKSLPPAQFESYVKKSSIKKTSVK